LRKNRAMFLLLAVLIATYTAITLLSPPDPKILEQYSLSVFQIRLLLLTIIFPLACIWTIGFVGFTRVANYSAVICKSKEAPAFRNLTYGLAVLAFGSPILSIANSLLDNLGTRNPSLHGFSTIVINYLQLVFALVAYYLLYMGARELKKLAGKEFPRRKYLIIAGGVLLLAIVYCFFALTDPEHNDSIYFLPDWLVVASIVLPYVYSWYLGLRTAVYIHFYQAKQGGILYRQAFSYMAIGIGIVVTSSIFTQLITAIGFATELNLRPLLVIVYALLAFIATGYVLIAVGANKLRRIEEV
jgi:hypothetical protein